MKCYGFTIRISWYIFGRYLYSVICHWSGWNFCSKLCVNIKCCIVDVIKNYINWCWVIRVITCYIYCNIINFIICDSSINFNYRTCSRHILRSWWDDINCRSIFCWNNTENSALTRAFVLSVLVLKVELARIELASKQGIKALSTCLLFFNCREG